jgi:hypothetical protein
VASASAPKFNTPSDTKVITVNATVQQSISCSLTGTEINFNVTNPGSDTFGDKTVGINCTASLAKGHGAIMSISASDLIGVSDGKHIPAAAISAATNHTNGLYYTLDPSGDGFYPLTLSANNGGVNDETDGITLSLKLAGDSSWTPDQYSGSVTVLTQVQ